MKPDDCHIATAELAAARSPCAKSKRGVALYDPDTGAHRGEGWNGPPHGAPCPGREICGDRCGKLCVHAEMRALRAVPSYRAHGYPSARLHLVHVKIGLDGRVMPGGQPSCWQCSREILDVGFVAGVWLYEAQYASVTTLMLGAVTSTPQAIGGAWRFYTAADFHAVTLRNARLA